VSFFNVLPRSKLLLPRYTTWFTTLLNTFTSLVDVVDHAVYPIYLVMLRGWPR